jgi:hypothetical protein
MKNNIFYLYILTHRQKEQYLSWFLYTTVIFILKNKLELNHFGSLNLFFKYAFKIQVFLLIDVF